MMRHSTPSRLDDETLRDALHSWLRAERLDVPSRSATPSMGGRLAEAGAESALAVVLRALPSPLPSAGFADRVLAKTRAAAPLAVDLGRRARAVVALALVLTGSSLAVVAPLVVALLAGFDPGQATLLFADALATLIQSIVELAGVGRIVGQLLHALLLGITSPAALVVLTLCAALALLLLRTLRGLLGTSHGRPAHVL